MSEAYWCMLSIWGTFAVAVIREMINKGDERI